MVIQRTLLTFIAVISFASLGLLGSGFSDNISENTRAITPATYSTLATRSEAFSVTRALAKIGSAADALGRATKRGLAETPTAEASARYSKLAEQYGISELMVEAIETNPATRARVAQQPFHGGEVLFEAPDGRVFTRYRPLQHPSEDQLLWALLDVDNVIGDFVKAAGDGAAHITGLPRSEFPRNNRYYNLQEFVEPTKRALRENPDHEPLTRFRQWLEDQGGLDAFLNEPSDSKTSFTLFHRYLVNHGLYSGIEVHAGAREGVAIIHDQWPIRVVTKRYGTGPDFAHVDADVPAESAAWVSKALGEHFDSFTIMGNDKADFAGNVFFIADDTVGNIATVRTRNASLKLRERAFARDISPEDLDAYLAEHNVDILGIAPRWKYNENDALLRAANVDAVDDWGTAAMLALVHHKLLTDRNAGASGRLHWSEVPGLVDEKGGPVALPKGRFHAE